MMKHIEEFFTIYRQCAFEKDVKSMTGLYDDDVVIFDMWDQGYQSGLAEWSVVIRDWLGSLGDEKVNVAFEMIKIDQSENLGFASALVTYQAISVENVVIRSMKNRITLGFARRNNAWKVVHQHTSAPINGDLTAILTF